MEETKSIVRVWAERQSKYYYDFYLLENDGMRRISSMCSSDLPDLFGWAFLYPHIYIAGGEFVNPTTGTEEYGQLSSAYSFDTTTCSTSKWEKIASMNGCKSCPILVPLKNRNRLYAFGGNDDSPYNWAEYYDCHPKQWISLPQPPPEVLERNEALGYVVIDNGNRIILWNAYFFFCLNLGSESDTPTWELQPFLQRQRPPINFSPYIAVLNDVLYWYCLDSLYAYDLAANCSFTAPLYKIDYTHLEVQHAYYQHQYPENFLVGTKEDELCIIWCKPKFDNTDLEVSLVKLRIERCDHHGILLHLNCSANFSLPDGLSLNGCLGAVNLEDKAQGDVYFSTDDAKARLSNSGIGESDYVPFMFENKGLRKVFPVISSSPTEAPISLLQKLSQTMYEYSVECYGRVSDSRNRRRTNHSSREISMQQDERSVDGLLTSLGLEKYICKFQEEKIDLDALKILDDEDFEVLAIPEDAKKKILDGLLEREGMEH